MVVDLNENVKKRVMSAGSSEDAAPKSFRVLKFATGSNTTLQVDAKSIEGGSSSTTVDALRVVKVGNAKNGTVEMFLDNVIFTPKRDFCGFATFECTMKDQDGFESPAQVTVTVGTVDEATESYQTKRRIRAADSDVAALKPTWAAAIDLSEDDCFQFRRTTRRRMKKPK